MQDLEHDGSHDNDFSCSYTDTSCNWFRKKSGIPLKEVTLAFIAKKPRRPQLQVYFNLLGPMSIL